MRWKERPPWHFSKRETMLSTNSRDADQKVGVHWYRERLAIFIQGRRVSPFNVLWMLENNEIPEAWVYPKNSDEYDLTPDNMELRLKRKSPRF